MVPALGKARQPPESARGKSAERRRQLTAGQQKQPSLATSQRSDGVDVQRRELLTNATQSIRLLCETLGLSQPKVSWTKDGTPVRPTDRVFWDSVGGLYIFRPRAGDGGVYRCLVMSEPGPWTQSSQQGSQLTSTDGTGAPAIAALKRDVHAPARSVARGSLTVRLGATVTLECPLTEIAWHRKAVGTNSSTAPVFSGSLLLNVSVENTGIYSCLASGLLGRTEATSLLTGTELGRSHSRDRSQRRVLMASRMGTNVTARPGDILRIGCPLLPSQRVPVSWAFQNRTLLEAPGPQHRMLTGGRVLEVNTLFTGAGGRYTCQTSAGPQAMLAWLHVHLEGFTWSLGEWTECSATCGPGGSQAQKVGCVSVGGEEAVLSLCRHLPRPVNRPRPCNVQDCPPSWVASGWSSCSSPCASFPRQRQVSCQQLSSTGLVTVLPASACAGIPRPPETDDCQSHSCTGWHADPWRQCSGQCLGPALTVQRRPVTCKHHNGSVLPESHCSHRNRPASVRNCSSELCEVHWRAGPWRPCSVACGSGFQSRRVECIQRGTNRTVAERLCVLWQRPAVWQNCVVPSCDGECEDTTHYCTLVKELDLCLIDLYQHRCCRSCRSAETPPIQ